ncbi:MAG: molybdenum cofactor biosynthesis protein C [SAR202 cluster bacterium Io17-Chloro-G3]|nr:MAG: molybdenum cofactor biosynthesis protein C [SAR202 cluster bacterium Io17-Chloro-G3]
MNQSPEPSKETLTHLNEEGQARMVDVGWKEPTVRVAVAKGEVRMRPGTLDLVRAGQMKKGDVLGIARIAGVMGAKRTSELIPLCHPIPLDQITVDMDLNDETNSVEITAAARTTAKTGVEMEALTAVSIAALTIYDMCKSIDREVRIDAVRLVQKSGGRSGEINLE